MEDYWKMEKYERISEYGGSEHYENQSQGNERCLGNQIRIKGEKLNSCGYKAYDGVKCISMGQQGRGVSDFLF